MKVFINNSRFLETVCEIADQITVAQFGEGFNKEVDGETLKHTEEAQDFFNEKYEEIESILNNILEVYSDTTLEINV